MPKPGWWSECQQTFGNRDNEQFTCATGETDFSPPEVSSSARLRAGPGTGAGAAAKSFLAVGSTIVSIGYRAPDSPCHQGRLKGLSLLVVVHGPSALAPADVS